MVLCSLVQNYLANNIFQRNSSDIEICSSSVEGSTLLLIIQIYLHGMSTLHAVANVELHFNTVKGGNLIKVQVFVKIYIPHLKQLIIMFHEINKPSLPLHVSMNVLFTINIIPLLWNVVIPHHV